MYISGLFFENVSSVSLLQSQIMIVAPFDFNSEVSVNILGHIFEQSIGDLEELKKEGRKVRKKDGVYYIFMEHEKFKHLVNFGDFIEWEIVHANKYGTLWSSLEDALDNNKVMIFDIDVKGAMTIQEEYPDESILVYRFKSIDPGIMMPELGRTMVHKEGLELIREWILNLN